jgi:hypothetical protein
MPALEKIAQAEISLRRIMQIVEAGVKNGRYSQSTVTAGLGRRFAVISSA